MGTVKLNELLDRVHSGRAISVDNVKKVIEGVLSIPLPAMYNSVIRMEMTKKLLEFGRIDGEEKLEALPMLPEIPALSYGMYLVRYIKTLERMTKQRSTVLEILAMAGTGNMKAFRAFNMELSEDRMGKFLNTPARDETQGDHILDQMFRDRMLPFLTLSVRDYLEYLDRFPEIKALEAWENWFRKDVELWESMKQKTPTVSDVLLPSWESVTAVSDLELDIVMEEVEPDAGVNGGEVTEPFRRKNIQGTFWPPEEEEGMLSGLRIWLLMVLGPTVVMWKRQSGNKE